MATATKEKAPKLTADQQWEQERTERAEQAAEDAAKETTRRAGMTPDQLAADDAKRHAAAAKETARQAAMTQEERNAEEDKGNPLPPWQVRLPSGQVFDAQAQSPLTLVTTGGQVTESGDRQAALEFYADYVVGRTSTDKKK